MAQSHIQIKCVSNFSTQIQLCSFHSIFTELFKALQVEKDRVKTKEIFKIFNLNTRKLDNNSNPSSLRSTFLIGELIGLIGINLVPFVALAISSIQPVDHDIYLGLPIGSSIGHTNMILFDQIKC